MFVFGNFSFVIRECQLENSCWFPLQVAKLHGMAGIRLEAKLLSKNSQITLPQTKQGVGHASPLQTEPLQRQLFAHINLTYDAHSEAFDGRGCRPWYSYTTGTGSGQVTTVSASHVDDVPHISPSLSLSPAISLSFCLYLYCQLCFEMKNADNCNKSHTHTWRGEATCRAQQKLKNANSFIKIIYDPTDNKKTGHITLRRP